MCCRSRAQGTAFTFAPSRLHFHQAFHLCVKHGDSWAWLPSSGSSLQSRNSRRRAFLEKPVSFRRCAPTCTEYDQKDQSTVPLVNGVRTPPLPSQSNKEEQAQRVDKNLLKRNVAGNGRPEDGIYENDRAVASSDSCEDYATHRTESNNVKEVTSVERTADRGTSKPNGLIPGVSQLTKPLRGGKSTMKSKINYILMRGDQAQRKEVMQLLREGKLMLSINEFNEVVSCLTRQKRLSEALSIVELTEQKPLSDLITISKSMKTYTILIDLYGRTQNLDRAFSIFYGMFRKGLQPNVITYNAMIAACSRNSEAYLANEVFKEMQDNGLKPDKFTYGSLIDLYAKNGNVDQAFELEKEMTLNGVEKDQTIYSALMEGCGRAEQPERAFQVYEEMKRDGIWPNMITFSVLIDICANAREPERAFHVFAEARHWGYTTPNVVVYTALIDACSKGGWPDKAELVLRDMIRNNVKPNHITYGALLDGWTRKGDFDRAFEVLNRMESRHKVRPNAILVGGLIDACRRHRQYSRVRGLWDVIVKYNIKPSRTYYPGLIAMAVSHGELQIACAIVLHAYARGHLRRVTFNSENPALHAMACALVYLRHELRVANSNLGANQNRKRADRLRVVFGSLAMNDEQMHSMAPSTACECALSWGDLETGEDNFRTHHQRLSSRYKSTTLSKTALEAARKAKDRAYENYRRYGSSSEVNGQ